MKLFEKGVTAALLCILGAICGSLTILLCQAKADLRIHQERGQLAILPFHATTELQEDYKQSALSEPSEANIARYVTLHNEFVRRASDFADVTHHLRFNCAPTISNQPL